MQKVEFVFLTWLKKLDCKAFAALLSIRTFECFEFPNCFLTWKAEKIPVILSWNWFICIWTLLHVLVAKTIFEGVRHNTSLVCNNLSSLQILFLCSTGACSPEEGGCIEGCINGEIQGSLAFMSWILSFSIKMLHSCILCTHSNVDVALAQTSIHQLFSHLVGPNTDVWLKK